MRVGIDATSVLDELTGVEMHVHTAVAALAAMPDVELVAFVRRRPPAEWSDLAVEAWPLATGSQALATQILLPRAAKRARVEVLYCPAKPPPAVSPIPVLDGMHDAVPWTQPETMGRGAARWYRVLDRRAVRRGAHVATVSEASAAALRSRLGVPTDRVHVVGNALAPWLTAAAGACHARPAVAGDRPYVLSLCRIEPRKDLATTLDGWDRLRRDLPDHRLLVAGQAGWGVDDVVARARATPGVSVVGEVARGDVPALYQHAAAFVSSSLDEGFGLPVLEAMAFGAPVVATSIPAHVEVGADALAGFAPGDAAGLATALAGVLTDAGRADRLRGLGRRRAAEWSIERMGTRLRSALSAAGA